MVVIAILGILSAIAIPNIIKYRENTQLRASATELLGTFRKAQIYAVKKHKNTLLEISESTVTVKDIDGNTIYTYKVHPSCKFADYDSGMGYTPRGLPVNKGSVVVKSTSTGSKVSYKVSLSFAGHTKLETIAN